MSTAPACPLLGSDCLPDIDVGSTILPGSSGQRGKVIGKPTFKMWVFLCSLDAVTDNDVDEDFSGWWMEKAIVVWFKFRLSGWLVIDGRK